MEYRCRKCSRLVAEVIVQPDGKKELHLLRQPYGDVGRVPGQVRTERRHGAPGTYSEAEIYQTETLGGYRPACGSCKVDFMLMYDRVVDDIATASAATRSPLRVFLDPIR